LSPIALAKPGRLGRVQLACGVMKVRLAPEGRRLRLLPLAGACFFVIVAAPRTSRGPRYLAWP